MANNNQIYKMSNAGGFKSLNRYYDMLAGNTVWNPWEPQGAFDALATVTVPSGGAATVTFSGIPSDYKHLQIRWLARGNRANVSDGVNISFNGSAMTNGHYIYADGASVSAGVQNSITTQIPASTTTANVFGAAVVDILDYANTNKNKTVRTLGGFDANGSGQIAYASTFQASTSAVTSITLDDLNGTGFVQYSTFALYGIK